MRKLRRPMPEPEGLSNYDYKIHKWGKDSPDTACRTAIWNKLNIMQNGFCAYCEGAIAPDNRHIEHFFHKGQKAGGITSYKKLTFDWSNLFGSCGKTSGDTCGHYKDRQGGKGPGQYNPDDIIKPDIEDPATFFNFLDTGVIEVKVDLTDNERRRASETLRVLNLAFLNAKRKEQIDIFRKELQALEVLSSELDDDILFEEIKQIKAKACLGPYQSAVLGALF